MRLFNFFFPGNCTVFVLSEHIKRQVAMKASAGPLPPPPAASHPIVCIYVNVATAAPTLWDEQRVERREVGCDRNNSNKKKKLLKKEKLMC